LNNFKNTKTMNIIEDAKDLESDFDKFKILSEKGEVAETFEQFAILLGPIKNRLENFKTPLKIMMDSEEIEISHKFNSVKGLSKKIEDLRDRYTKSSKKTVLDPFPKQDVRFYLIGPLNELVNEIDVNLRTAWESWTRKEASSGISEETLEVLSVAGLEGVADLKKKLITIKTHLDELPKNKRDLDEVKSLGDSIRSAWKELDAPTEVINFLKEASEEGASLDLLSENVNKWLKEKGLIKKLKVKISSGQTITQTFR
jgi:hypothetical protein